MIANQCPDLELLFTELVEGQGPSIEHAQSCPACSAIVEEHRQMEKDLFRLADPLPPPDFVLQVMAKVEKAPAPVMTEVRAGIGIVSLALALAVAVTMLRGGNLAHFGTGVASGILTARSLMIGLAGALDVVWRTAAVPLTVSLTVLLAFSLFGLRRFAGSAEMKVLS